MYKKATYYAIHDDAMKNASYFRKLRPHHDYAAHYVQGDYMGNVSTSLVGKELRIYSREEAKQLLPKGYA